MPRSPESSHPTTIRPLFLTIPTKPLHSLPFCGKISLIEFLFLGKNLGIRSKEQEIYSQKKKNLGVVFMNSQTNHRKKPGTLSALIVAVLSASLMSLALPTHATSSTEITGGGTVNATADTTYKLTDDLNLSQGLILNPNSHTTSLDLDGHTLTGDGKDTTLSIGIYNNGKGNFTLTGDGTVTGGYGSEHFDGGGVQIERYTHFTLENGTITGNKSDEEGGGIKIEDNSSFTMTGGSITGNSAAEGGGLYVFRSPFTMSGGSITGNTATTNGGGVYMNSWSTDDFKMEGLVTITGNTVNGEPNNVYLPSGQTISLVGPLDQDSRIGITMASPGVFTTDASGNATVENFSSDSSLFEVAETDDGEFYLKFSNVEFQGNGTLESPYLLETVKDLQLFSEVVLLSEDMAKSHYKLVNDLNLSSIENWSPIGDYFTPFSGTFDGDGHTITGLNSDGGFFYGIGAEGVVKNLSLTGVTIQDSFWVGGIASENYGLIHSSTVSGSIEGYYFLGGIAGENYGMIANCYNTAAISAFNNVGGIAGQNYGTISNCYNIGMLTVTEGDDDNLDGHYEPDHSEPDSPSQNVVGGIVGENSSYSPGTLENCYWHDSTILAIGNDNSDSNGASLIDTKDALLQSLNNWVDSNSTIDYKSWEIISTTNQGYPIFESKSVSEPVIPPPVVTVPSVPTTVTPEPTFTSPVVPVHVNSISGTGFQAEDILFSTDRASEGGKVMVTLTNGVTEENIVVKDEKGNIVQLIPSAFGDYYYFIQPNSPLSFVVTMEEKKEISLAQPTETTFQDVNPGDWYYNAIRTVGNLGLLPQDSVDNFYPNHTATRAMVATLFYHLAGSPAQSQPGFDDVPSTAWYADATTWAKYAELIVGVGENNFNPESSVTREEFVTIMYGYYQMIQGDASWEHQTTSVEFTDQDDVNQWAQEALGWCYHNGVIGGLADGSFNPQGTATRGEVVAMLDKFIQIIS